MTKPRPIRRGDPFSVRMMNQVIQESKSHRRGGASGEGVFNDELGNQTFNQTSQRMRLVVPIEEFAIPENPTDTYDKIDKVKSAPCMMLRIDAETDYKKETRALPFRVWDVISYINETESPGLGEAFYAVYDSDCKRWHRLSGGGGGGGSKIGRASCRERV